MERKVDFVFLVYFVINIPIAVLIDSQGARFPKWLYPTQLLDVMDWYTAEFRDPMMKNPPEWFQAFCITEVFLQLPFLFFAVYAYWQGVSKCRWIRIPVIIYSVNVITTLVAILFHIAAHDFSTGPHPGPRKARERCRLAAIYVPYVVLPLMLLFDAIFSEVYIKHKPAVKQKRL